MFLLLVLVHLLFFHSVSCGWLPFWGSSAGCSFPNGRPSGKRSSSSYRPGGRRRFIGVRGVGSFFRTFGFPEVGAVSFPDPFRRLSVPPLAGLEGQGCGNLSCRGAAAGLLSALPQHSSSSIVPIPMPSSSPISISGAALEEVTLGFIATGALELAPLPSPGFYSHLFVVWKTSGSWRPVTDLFHLFALWTCHTFRWRPFSLCSCRYVRGTGWPPSFSRKRIFKCWFILLLVTFFASCSVARSTSSKLCALASPWLRRSSPGSWLLFQLSSILWVSVCVDTSTIGWSSLPLGSLS